MNDADTPRSSPRATDLPPPGPQASPAGQPPAPGTIRLRAVQPQVPAAAAAAQPPPAPARTSGTALYQELLNGLYEAVLITDPRGRVLEANARAESLFKGTRLELLCCRAGDLISGFTDAVLAQVSRQAESGSFALLDAQCIRLDGTTCPAEIAIGRTHITWEQELCFSLRDVSVRRSAQRILTTAYRALHGSPCGVAIIDLDGAVEYVNPAFLRLWGHPPSADLGGRPMASLWAPQLVEKFRKCLADGRTVSDDLSLLRKSGERTFIQATCSPHEDGAGKTIGLCLFFVDVTPLKLAQEGIKKEADAQLRRAREKDDFAGLINIISVPDAMQLIAAARKTGTLEIRNDEIGVSGEICFSSGQIVSARCGERTGAEAVYRLLRCRSGGFQFRHGVVSEPNSAITLSTMSMLLEGMRRIDEDAARTPEK